MTIRHMLDDSLVANIKDCVLENLGWKNASQIANRFNWINGSSFETISMSGIERVFVLKLKEGLKYDEKEGTHEVLEHGFTVIPHFDPDECEDYHFFIERTPISSN